MILYLSIRVLNLTVWLNISRLCNFVLLICVFTSYNQLTSNPSTLLSQSEHPTPVQWWCVCVYLSSHFGRDPCPVGLRVSMNVPACHSELDSWYLFENRLTWSPLAFVRLSVWKIFFKTYSVGPIQHSGGLYLERLALVPLCNISMNSYSELILLTHSGT